MAQFQYTAVNNTGKKLSGVIGAATQEEARKELNALGISVLVMNKIADTGEQSVTTEASTSDDLPKFEFEAFDKTGRKVLGTIPASNRYKAFKRLMEEYQFEVSYVVDAGATPEEKLKAKQEDLNTLKTEYETQMKAEGKLEEEDSTTDNSAFEKKRELLLKKVDMILNQIKKLLADYKDDIKPENQKIIQNYVDKLLRIKSSTNLDYIQHTSEELLKRVQDQELFLHKEQMESQRNKLKLESQKLMAELHSGPTDTKDYTDDLAKLKTKFAGSDSRLLKGLSQWIQSFLPTLEEKDLKSRIKVLNQQMWTYWKMWIQAPKSSKESLKQSINNLKKEKKKLQEELKQLKKSRKKPESSKNQNSEPLLTEEISHFLGWLLSFYLAGYFMSHYALSRGFMLPGDFNLLHSGTLRGLLMTVFLWYILLSIRIDYFRYKKEIMYTMIPAGILTNAIILFNF